MKNLSILLVLTWAIFTSTLLGSDLISPVRRFGIDHLHDPGKLIANNGEVYVIESKLSHVGVFANDGSLLMFLGKSGEGPMEFKNLRFFTVSNKKIYCFDWSGYRFSVFSQQDKKFLKYISLNNTVYGSPPVRIAVHDDGTMVIFNNGFLKEHTLLALYAADGTLLKRFFNAYPAYPSRSEFDESLKQKKPMNIDFYKNAGNIAIANKKIYFANYTENHVVEIGLDGKTLNRYPLPLPSHEKTARIVEMTGANGNSSYLENQLNYDLKAVNNTIYTLCRDNGLSYICCLVKGTFKEVCRMKESLFTFDIMDGKIFAIEDESEDEDKSPEVLVYDLPKN